MKVGDKVRIKYAHKIHGIAKGAIGTVVELEDPRFENIDGVIVAVPAVKNVTFMVDEIEEMTLASEIKRLPKSKLPSLRKKKARKWPSAKLRRR